MSGLQEKKVKREIRSLGVTLEAQRRAQGPDGEAAMVLEGHAAVFDKPADLYWFTETIARGSFLDSIQRDDIRALLNHDPNFVLGRNRAGTLTLAEDAVGLQVVIHLPNTTTARDLYESVSRGDISQMSFMFDAVRVEWSRNEETKQEFRKILEAKLYDVSVVTFPAYEETDIMARNVRDAESIFQAHRQQLNDGEHARVRMASRRRILDILSRE